MGKYAIMFRTIFVKDVYIVKFKGIQIAMDLYNCDGDVIEDKDAVKDIIEDAAKRHSMKEINLYYNENAESNDYSYLMPCQYGHINLHIFPDLGFVAADIFTVDEAANPEELVALIRKQLAPDKSKLTILKRGDFGSINDMKPRRKKQVRTMHRAKTAGAVLKKLVLRPKQK